MVSASLLGRLFRLGLLFLVLMVGATYTANLASFLNQKHLPWADDIRRTETKYGVHSTNHRNASDRAVCWKERAESFDGCRTSESNVDRVMDTWSFNAW